MGLHFRMLWYQFGPYESYYATGRYDDVVALADAPLLTADNLEESYYWRGMARLAQGDRQGARTTLRLRSLWETICLIRRVVHGLSSWMRTTSKVESV